MLDANQRGRVIRESVKVVCDNRGVLSSSVSVSLSRPLPLCLTGDPYPFPPTFFTGCTPTLKYKIYRLRVKDEGGRVH